MNIDYSSTSTSQVMEGDEQVYPCRCGVTHRGEYAVYDYGHHMCFHDAGLDWLDDDLDALICVMCGNVFGLNSSKEKR